MNGMDDARTIDPATLAGLSREEMLVRLTAAGLSIPERSTEDRLFELEIEVAKLKRTQFRVEKASPLDWASQEYWKGTRRAMAHGLPVFVLIACFFIFVIMFLAQ